MGKECPRERGQHVQRQLGRSFLDTFKERQGDKLAWSEGRAAGCGVGEVMVRPYVRVLTCKGK